MFLIPKVAIYKIDLMKEDAVQNYFASAASLKKNQGTPLDNG